MKLWWEQLENGEIDYSETEIETHFCSSEELGLSGTDHSFWPINEAQKSFMNASKSKFICVDPSDLLV